MHTATVEPGEGFSLAAAAAFLRDFPPAGHDPEVGVPLVLRMVVEGGWPPQRTSKAAASNAADRLTAAYGTDVVVDGVTHRVFPTPAQLASVETPAGVNGTRAAKRLQA